MLPAWFKIELKEAWEGLKVRLGLPTLRRWINEYPRVVVSVAGASAMLLLAIIIWLKLPDKPAPQIVTIEKEWYYDLNTDELFVADKGLEPPIEAPSGPLPSGKRAGVRAYVLSYTDEPNESKRFIAFLETIAPPEMMAKWPTRRDSVSAAKRWGKGRLIRRIEDQMWIPADSKLGQQLINDAFAPNKNGDRPTYCSPR
jgi:hypothetical protein